MSVLEAEPPRFSPEQAAELAAELFGVSGSATALGSERDQAFLIDDGGPGGVLKISNSGEDPAVLDLEREAILHLARVDPELPVRLRLSSPAATSSGSSTACRAGIGGRSCPTRRFASTRGRTLA
jgi:Ser/Thr protein kinase RdoA (MazF antagonist)